MTREDLLQKVSAAIDETLYAYSHGEMSDDMAKESILALIPPQPKLEWREAGLSGGFEELRLNHLVVGFVFEKADGYGFIGSAGARTEFSRSFRARAEARAAVEKAVKEALYLTKVVRSGPEPIESPWAEDE